MDRKRPFIVLTAALLVIASISVPAAAISQVIGSPSTSLFTPDNEFTPGEEASLEVYVSNQGSIIQSGPERFTSRVTTARGLTLEPLSTNAPVEINTGTVPLGTVPTGVSQPATFQITVAESADPGTYRIPIRVKYEYTRFVNYENQNNPEFVDSTHNKVKYITINIEESARFEVVNVQNDVRVGDQGTVTMTLRNTGGQIAKDAAVTLSSANADVTLGGGSSASRYVGAWPSGTNQTVTFDATVAERAGVQSYSLTAQVDYNDEDGVAKRSKQLTTKLRPQNEQTFTLQNATGTLQVGRDGTLTGTIINAGPGTAYDAVVSVRSSASGIDFEEREYALGTLTRGEQADFALPVELSDSANAGEQQFTYTVTYQNENNKQRTSDSLNARVTIGPKQPLFGVDTVETTVEAGSSATVTVALTNNAQETLRNIDAKAFIDDPLSLSNDEAFIPRLEPGETTEVSFVVSSGGSALQRMYALSVDFQYENSEYETKLSDTYAVGVEVVEPTDDGGNFPLPLIIGVVLVIAIGGAIWYRRR